MKKGCIFDLDGTLVNSLHDLAISTNKVLEQYHLPTHEISKYNQFVGNGVRKLIERAVGENHRDLVDSCLETFYQIYEEHCLDHTLPYPGIIDLIHDLNQKGVKMAVVTNKPHHLAIKIVETIFPECFIAILGQQNLYPVKPHPESTYLALMTMKLSKYECFFIGDSNVDIETGNYAEIETIGVCWGFRGRAELEATGADYVVEKPNEIKELIK